MNCEKTIAMIPKLVCGYIIPSFEEIFSLKNLFLAWQDFKKGKKNKKDVAEFSMKLVHNLTLLHQEIISGVYKHQGYIHFKINDPKPRDIHKASVRDRVVHHALYNALYPYFDAKFIFDSYSCRLNKGTHKALNRFREFAKKESCNYTKTIWILKCDIRKCFASVDHCILKSILTKEIQCPRLLRVVSSVIDSFPISAMAEIGKVGIPLGNLTSQIFINIYLNELDLYMKHRIKAEKYIRYADDFILFSKNKNDLLNIISVVDNFLKVKLHCDLHDKKLFVRSLYSGVDFLGWIHFPRYRVLRAKTKRRILKNIVLVGGAQIASYMGLLQYGNTFKIKKIIEDKFSQNMLPYRHGN